MSRYGRPVGTILLALLLFIFSHSASGLGPNPIGVENCPKTANFERDQYLIRRAYVEDPFSFLRWLAPVMADADNAVGFLNGQPYSLAVVRKGEDALEKFAFVNESSEAVAITITVVAVKNCSGKQLDVVYRIYSTRISPILATTRESWSRDEQAPQDMAGIAKLKTLQFQPIAGYDRSNRFFLGAHAEAHMPPSSKFFPFQRLVAEGWGSTSAYSASVALAGTHDSTSAWMQHMEWQLNYAHSESPTDLDSLQQGRLAAQFAATSRAAGKAGLVFRFGGMLEGGMLQSGFPAIDLAADTVSSAGYGSLKLYSGTSGRTRHQVFSASYGLELGSTGGSGQIDWRKHIGDVAYDLWYPAGNHRQVEFESRLAVGGIQIPGSIPVAARFFGGNQEQLFIPSGTWQIRANPVIRSIPANRFYRSADGAGGDIFTSYNLTAAYTVWRKPVVPNEILKDPSFKKQLDGGLTSAISTVAVTYLAKDEHFLSSLSHVEEVRDSAKRFQVAVKAAEGAHAGQFLQEFSSCKSSLVRASQRAASAIEAKPADAYGLVAALLNSDPSGDENRLQKARLACIVALNQKLNDATIAAEGTKLASIADVMQKEFDQIDQARASAQAEQEMGYVKTTLQTLLYDVNLFSISPVTIFDVGYIGPANTTLGGTRYGTGAGVRFTLVSSVSFTAGYAWNIHPHIGEGRGALFFALRFRDLFQ